MVQQTTKTRIMDVAEHLFATRGVSGTSIRNITSRAKVNLAAVHYHFGSKESVLEAVVSRRLDPLTAERSALLDEYERQSKGGAVELPKIIDKAPVGRKYVDGNVSVDEESQSIKDRKNLSFNGFLENTIIINSERAQPNIF